MRGFKIQKSVISESGECLKAYFREISHYPTLSANEETDLAIRIAAGDRKAFDKMVTSNLRFVVSVARYYASLRLYGLADLIAEGNHGLVVAVTKFDHTRGIKFISFAVWWIRHYMTNAISEHSRMIRLPANQIAVIISVYHAEIKLETLLNRTPTVTEVSEHTGIPEMHIQLAYVGDLNMSYLDDEKLQGDGGLSLLHTVEDTLVMRADLILEKQEMEQELRLALRRLPGRQGEILNLFLGLDQIGQMTIDEIAKHLGMSPQSVQLNKTKGLAALRSRPEFGYLQAYFYR